VCLVVLTPNSADVYQQNTKGENMKKYTSINSPVHVSALGFSRSMRTFPRRMEFGGITYNFVDAGLRTTLRSGERVAQIFTMSDGMHDYRLKSDNGCWTLLGMA
jgi:hypothetical protein